MGPPPPLPVLGAPPGGEESPLPLPTPGRPPRPPKPPPGGRRGPGPTPRPAIQMKYCKLTGLRLSNIIGNIVIT